MKCSLRWRKIHTVNKALDDWRITPSFFKGIERPLSVTTNERSNDEHYNEAAV